MPGLEQRLKRQDDAPKKQAGGDREHQRPIAQPARRPATPPHTPSESTPVKTITWMIRG